MDGHLATQALEDGSLAPVAMAGLAAGVLIVGADGTVRFANAYAVALFSPLAPREFTLRALLGLAGATGGSQLADAVDTGLVGRGGRIGLPDRRILDSQVQPAAGGDAVVTLFDVTDYVRDAELGRRDALTGLANRTILHERLTELLAHAAGTCERVAVISLDLDRFKAVNDTLGHPVGDGLLITVAERLRNAVRKTDVVARMGGDEFTMLQIGASQPQDAERLALRLVDVISRAYLVAEHSLHVGASVGIAISPGDGEDAATLLKHADLALYKAKLGGRGRFCFFQAAMDAEMQARLALETALRRAVTLKEFTLAYQPQIDLASNTLIGFEALMRWQTPDRGVVSPADFIPLAEEIGVIGAIGEWVLQTACREAVGWEHPVSVAVNISAHQFRDAKLVALVKSTLASTRLAPERLELEITEGALLENTERVLVQLNELKAMGIKISMDDFGTGYSSLSYLQKFPFDKIKIDQSFVRGPAATADGGAIVRAVAALGASLGMQTTAEGVETDEQLARIRAHGCNVVQGYLTGRPLSPEAAGQLARQTGINHGAARDHTVPTGIL